MAKELAAIAKTPNGATMTVVIICAPQITRCSSPIGKPIWNAFFKVLICGRKRPCSPDSLSSLERDQRYHSNIPATTASAAAVPNAAPSTPRPAPGIVKETPATFHSRDGKIRKKLKTTSNTHIVTPSRLGTCILPLHRSMPPAKKFICMAGRKSEKIRK